MARSTIAGFTVAIGADTDQFQKAIKEIDRVSKNVAKDLKTVSESMKFDPKSLTDYASKYKLLEEAVDVSAKKVELAKKAIEALNKEFAEEKVSPEDYQKSIQALQRQLESAQYEYTRNVSALRDYSKATLDSTDSVKSLAEAEKQAADSTKTFADKFNDIEKEAGDISKELKIVNERLKLDPKNVELLGQKMDLLKAACANAASKVDLIKGEIAKLNEAYSDKSSEEYKNALKALNDQLKIAENEYALARDKVDAFGKELDSAGKSSSTLADIIKGSLISKVIMDGLKSLEKLAMSIARSMIQAAKKVFEFSQDCVKAAASYQDAVEYSEKVYGEYAKYVQDWVKENSGALRIGIANLQVYMNDLGTAFSALGLNHQQAMEMAQNLISLSADVRAATGKDIDEIISAMTRGFTSSTRNFRQFGVYVNEADIKIQALKDGIIEFTGDQEALNAAMEAYAAAAAKADEALKAYGEDSEQFRQADAEATAAAEALTQVLGGQEVALTSSQRAVALYNLVMERLGFLVGQNEKESGLYNSQVELLHTNFANLKLMIGDKLLPVFTDLVTKFNEFLASDEGQAILQSIADAFGNIAQKIAEMTQDGTIQRIVNEFIEKAPEVITQLGNIIEQLIELAPAIFDLTEKLLALFGIETEAEKSRQAFYDNKKAIGELAEEYGTDLETMKLAISAFAESEGLELSYVLGNWEFYAPQVEAYMKEMKANADANLGGFQQVLIDFAHKNNISLNDIYSDWNTYEPQIAEYVQGVGGEYKTEFDKAYQIISEFATQNGLDLNTLLQQWNSGNTDIGLELIDFAKAHVDMKDAVVGAIEELGPAAQAAIDNSASNLNTSKWDNVWRWVKQAVKDVYDFLKLFSPAWWMWQVGEDVVDMAEGASMAMGGRAYAHRPYLVGDDAQNRPELFIPDTNGTILNGDKTERILNSVNNSNNVGDVIIYVNSYGMDVAAVAEELGEAFQKKIRMSGAMI